MTTMVSGNIFHNISNLWLRIHFLLEQRYITKTQLFARFSNFNMTGLYMLYFQCIRSRYYYIFCCFNIFDICFLYYFSSLLVLFKIISACLFLQVRVVKVGSFKLIECKFMILHSYWPVEILKKMGQGKSVFALSISISLAGMCWLRPICDNIQHTASAFLVRKICNILPPLNVIYFYGVSVISTHFGSFLWLIG